MSITVIVTTKKHPAPDIQSCYSSTPAGLQAAARDVMHLGNAYYKHAEEVHVWAEVDGRKVDVTRINVARTQDDARLQAMRILFGWAE